MNYLKQNHLSIITLIVLAAMFLLGGSSTANLGATTARTTITNPWTFSQPVTLSATTTLADTVALTNPGICINFYATSTATISHMIASTTATVEGVDGVMMFGYGACAL